MQWRSGNPNLGCLPLICIFPYSFRAGLKSTIISAKIILINSFNVKTVGFSYLSWKIIDREIFTTLFFNYVSFSIHDAEILL